MVHSREDAQRILGPYNEVFSDIAYSAIGDYRNSDSLAQARHTRRSKSSIINDYMVHHAKEKLTGLPGIQFVQVRGGTRIIVGNEFQVRLKKLDDRLRSSNVPTQLVMDFLFQVQALLPGMPDRLTNVVVGYQWNALQTEPKGVYIVCPRGLHNEWVIPLPSRAALAERVPEYLRAGDEVPPRRIRLRDESASKVGEQERHNGSQ
jgi:hypothetical protein